MAMLRDEEEQQGQGTSQALGQGTTPQAPQGAEQPQQQTSSSSPATIGVSAPAAPMPKQRSGTGTFANLKTYLQAAQGGGQQKVAQAAGQQVQKLGTGAQRGLQQAQQTFGRRMEAGTLKGMETAGQEAKGIIGTAKQATYKTSTPTAQPQAQPQVAQPAATPSPTAEATQTAATPAAQAESVIPQQQYFTPEQQQRFAEIINAQYQGPASLQQAGLYEQAAQKARTAQEAAQKTQSALGREQLLKDIFGRTRDYGRGVSKLDALLLNTSQQGIQNLQEQAQPAAKAQEALQAAQNISTNEAAQRKAAIEGIRSGARQEFTETRTAEEQATEKRIDDLIKTPAVDAQGNKIAKLDSAGNPIVDAGGNTVYQTEWDRLPEYFRQSLANKGANIQKIKQEQLDIANELYKPILKQINEVNARKDAIQGQINKAKKEQQQIPRQRNWGSFGGEYFLDADKVKYMALRDKITSQTNQLNSLNNELSAISNTPEYQTYQNQLNAAKSLNMNQWALSPEEAAILGVGAGEGLYNIRPEDIRATEADRAKLITKDELSRQLALSQLAGTDISNELQKQLMYSDLSKAGTQNLSKSLDVDAFRRLLDESQAGFKTAAEGANLTGSGSKKVSRGNWRGKKTKTYYASVGGNVADMLRQAGYDVGAGGTDKVKSLLSDQDLLNRYLGATSTNREEEANIGGSALEGTIGGAGTGASIGSITGTGPIGAGIGAAIGAGAGGMAGANTTDQIQLQTDLAKELDEKLGIKGLGAIGQGVQDVRSAAGNVVSGVGNIAGKNVVGDVFRGIGGAIGGINTGAMKAYGDAVAKSLAIANLRSQYAQWLQGQGFENRANIVDTEATRARTAALTDLLRRRG
jgi:hypothetical protein